MEQTSYQFTKRVSAEGTIFLDNLPAGQEFTILVKPKIDKVELKRRLDALRKEFQANNPLAKMSQAELDAHLKRTRDEAYDQLNENRS